MKAALPFTTADTLLERGVAALEQQRKSGTSVDSTAALFLVYEQARRLMTRGELDKAQGLFAEAARLAEAAGNEISATIARGAIADILYRRGDLDEALRILREELIPVFERLGEVRSRAVTMGKIAHILVQKGDVGAGRTLQMERLEINQRLADADGIGATLWDLAQLELMEQKIEHAVPRIFEAYDIACRLGRAEGIAATGQLVGQILAANDKPDDARYVLRRSAGMFRKLGRTGDAQ